MRTEPDALPATLPKSDLLPSDRKTPCYLCEGSSFYRRPGTVRDAPSLEIAECASCGLVSILPPDDRGEDFYANSGMHESSPIDMDEWLKSSSNDDRRRADLLNRLTRNQTVLDVGCGAGGFAQNVVSNAKRVVAVEPEARARKFVDRLGIDTVTSIDKLGGERFDIITLFHVIEHLPDPRALLSRLRSTVLMEQGTVVIEVPSSSDALLTIYRCAEFSRFTYWSCHLNLFNSSTLELLSRQAGFSSVAIHQVQRYPLSNHLYWLREGRPGGHTVWNRIDTPSLTREYETALAGVGACDTLIAFLSP